VDAHEVAIQAVQSFEARLRKNALLSAYQEATGGRHDDDLLRDMVAVPYYGDTWPRHFTELRQQAADPSYYGPILNQRAYIAAMCNGWAMKFTAPANPADGKALERLTSLLNQTPGATWDQGAIRRLGEQVLEEMRADSTLTHKPSPQFWTQLGERRPDSPTDFTFTQSDEQSPNQAVIKAASENPIEAWINQPRLSTVEGWEALPDLAVEQATLHMQASTSLHQAEKEYNRCRSHKNLARRDPAGMTAALASKAAAKRNAVKARQNAQRIYGVQMLAHSATWDGQPPRLPTRACLTATQAKALRPQLRRCSGMMTAWEQQTGDCGEPLFAMFGGIRSKSNPGGIDPEQADQIVNVLRAVQTDHGEEGLRMVAIDSWLWWADQANQEEANTLLG
jgi:hypothetical protein